ncbi:Chitinase A [Planctomycetaceae bacterium]|nr:Chitinase A [Planctomycetaceae bacterium]
MSQVPATASSWGIQYGYACAASPPGVPGSYYQFSTFGAAWAFDKTGKLLWKGTGGQVTQALITGWIASGGSSNNPPTANAGADQAVNQGVNVSLSGAGSSDPDGDTLTYSWTKISGPAITLQNATTVSPSFTAPAVSSPQVITIRLTVSDGKGGTDQDTVDITVNPGPLPPNANAGPTQGAMFNVSVTLNASASTDPNGDTLTFAWVQVGGAAVTLNSPNTATPSFTSPGVPDVLVFQVTVSDPGGLTDTATVTVHVNATGMIPLQAATGGGGGACSAGAGGSAALLGLLALQALAVIRRRRK